MSSPKTALVTGAAARIGACTAETLHSRGCNVLLHCNSSVDRAQALADKLNGQRAGSGVYFARMQVNEESGKGKLVLVR